ncbi:MAG TPA: SusE domain-containing protein [Chitinophagaceae bacterium]|nr:SusE domain-containing protein [Chitinophagaceae bacterium]
MKAWFNKLFFIALAPLVLWSCKKEETRVYLEKGAPQLLSVSGTSFVLDSTKASSEVVIFAWDAVRYGFPSGSSYSLQFDKAGGDFTNPVKVENIGTERKKSYTTAELNKLLLLAGFPAGSASQVLVRLKSEIAGASTAAPQYSNVVTLTITPYLVKVVYPSLFVPGNYQGWSPATAKTIAAFTANSNYYEGYINFPDPNIEFKYTDAPNWSNGIFGDANSSGTSGDISSPGDNFKVANAGYYRLTAELNEKKWTATKTSWGIIGDATPTGWGSDTDMSYDSVKDVWTITIALIGGKAIKFRANDEWTINLGDKNADSILDYDGTDIVVAESGTYKVELDLSDAGNYTYRLTKQ